MASLNDKNPKKDIILILGGYFLYLATFGAIYFISLTAFFGFTERLFIDIFSVFGLTLVLSILWQLGVKGLHFFGVGKDLVAFIHDPEGKPLGNLNFVKNPFKLFIVSSIFFTILGFFATIFSLQGLNFQNVIFPLTPFISPQQVTPFSSIVATIFASPSENSFLYLLIGLIASITIILLKTSIKKPSESTIYWTAFAVTVPLGALIWLQIHNLVSGANQIYGLSHFLFGGLMVSMIFLTGSIIPAELYHLHNNLFIKIGSVLGIEFLLIFFIILLVLEGYIAYKIFTSEKIGRIGES